MLIESFRQLSKQSN